METIAQYQSHNNTIKTTHNNYSPSATEYLSDLYNTNPAKLRKWNLFFVEYIESLISNPFVYFQELQYKKPSFDVKYVRFNRFIDKNYTGLYPDIQLYNFFAFLYSIQFFKSMTEIKRWKDQKQELFMNFSYNELIKSPNGINFIKCQLAELPILNK